MKVKHVTPAEAKQMWLVLGKPSTRIVADWFKAAGRPVHHSSIWEWKRDGWPGTSAADVTKAAAAALANIDRVASALRGDVRSTEADVVEPNATAKAAQETSEPPDGRGNAECAEEALLMAIAGATSVWESIRDIATVVPSGRTATDTDARPVLLLEESDGIAKLMMAASAAINTAIEGFRQLSHLRAEEAAAVPGVQTVYPPGHGPHVESSDERDYPSRSAIEAVDQALKDYREGKL